MVASAASVIRESMLLPVYARLSYTHHDYSKPENKQVPETWKGNKQKTRQTTKKQRNKTRGKEDGEGTVWEKEGGRERGKTEWGRWEWGREVGGTE